MTLAKLLTQPLSVQTVNYTALDEYGNQKEGTLSAPVTVLGYLEQTDSTEVLVDRDTVVTNWQAWLPADTVISHLDRITYNGATFQVVGNPTTMFNPRIRRAAFITVHLSSVLG